MNSRVWDAVTAIFPRAGLFRTFQKQSGAILAGSFVLKQFTGDTDWTSRDFDFFAPLTHESVDAFLDLLQALEGDIYHIIKHDSLDSPCTHTGTEAARIPRGKKEWAKWRENSKRTSAVLKLNNFANQMGQSLYTKHVRSVYFAVELKSGVSFDVVLIPEADVRMYKNGIIGWAKYNVDFNICCNAITATSAYCLAPFDIADRIAFLRTDQYCCYPFVEKSRVKFVPGTNMPRLGEVWCEIRISKRWDHNKIEKCNCSQIVHNRIKKYHERRFAVVAGNLAKSEAFKKRQVPTAKDAKRDTAKDRKRTG
eukprot:TRINITY_DN886_c0_g1_i2.p1 TRINITY_DN886_c0_g1~~TRINITY_DN886_c0_g1_i2.p1  ORF type:complete len:360 (-),score=45.32 TRINITY_DN886_c0_g1_i2:126-1052(-)